MWKKISSETFGTLGGQKLNNYALNESITRDEFIKELTDGLENPPAYFPMNVKMNQEGYNDIDEVIRKNLNPLNAEEFEKIANQTGAIILDVRNQIEFAKEHISKSIFIGIDGGFAPWVGSIIGDVKQPILFIAPKGREIETITRLARVGFDNTLGFLSGGISSWKSAGKETDSIQIIEALSLKEKIDFKTTIVDVRKKSEFKSGHIKNSFKYSFRQTE